MPTIQHAITGGWSTEQGPKAPTILRGTDTVEVSWLMSAENVIYNRDGWPQKMSGAANVNGTTMGAAYHTNGIFDYWRSGTGGTPTQQRVVYSGTEVFTESSGTMTSIISGLTASQRPWFEVMNDTLVIAFSGADVPRTWDQTTAANLGGSPPNFGFHTSHKTRMVAAGVAANQSRLYYTVLSNHEDWTGSGAGSLDIAPDDGDVITGIWSHLNELIIFKGPNKGRIYRLTGSTPSDYALVPQFRGVGCVAQ